MKEYQFKGTPAPWTVSDTTNWDSNRVEYGIENEEWTVADIYADVEELKGAAIHNANLIAAAPDLLDACKLAMLLLIDRELDDTETFKYIQSAVHKSLGL